MTALRKPEQDYATANDLPNNIEAEQALLGAVMVNNAAYDAIEGLEGEDFFEPIHRQIWLLIGEMTKQGRPCNPITLKPYLRADDKVGDLTVTQYLVRLCGEAISVINAPDFAKAIIEAAALRRVISLARGLEDTMKAKDPTMQIGKEIDWYSGQLDAVRERVDLGSSTQALEKSTYANSLNRTTAIVSSAPQPFNEIKAVLSEDGWDEGNLYGLVAASGEGKTSLTIHFQLHAVERGHPVLFLSFDQSELQTKMQMVQQRLAISARRQKEHRRDKPALSHKELEQCFEFDDWLNRHHYYFHSCQDENVNELIPIIRRWRKRLPKDCKTPMVFLDHIQAVTPLDRRVDAGTQVKMTTRPLKAMAKKLGISILILNQRNSDGGKRPNPKPKLADMYGGEGAKQDYDAILALYRPYHWHKEIDFDAMPSSTQADEKARFRAMRPFMRKNRDGALHLANESYAEIVPLKVRFGRADVVRELRFIGDQTKFESTVSYEDEFML